MSESLYWTWLSLKLGAASPYLNTLLLKYSTPKDIFDASVSEIRSIEKIPESVKTRLCDKELDRSQRIMEKCKALGIGIMTYNDPRYPRILKYIDKPPAVLYFKGRPVDFDRRFCVSVVGTRKMSDYGRDMAYKFAYDLASAGSVIVSGMALGCDGMSAAGALDAQAQTVAVLGGGVDVIYPREHRKLYDAILKDGLVISEYPPGTEADSSHFPQRNRIISGLSRCTLVVESPEKSGAHITARASLDQGRPVFAVPGAIGMENSVGANNLIKQGARMATSAFDIIDAFESASFEGLDGSAIGDMNYDSKKAANRYGVASRKHDKRIVKIGGAKSGDAENTEPAALLGMEKEQSEKKQVFVAMSPAEKCVYDAIPDEGEASLELIIAATGQSVSDVTMHLLSLGLKKAIVDLPGGRYRRT